MCLIHSKYNQLLKNIQMLTNSAPNNKKYVSKNQNHKKSSLNELKNILDNF